MFTSKAHPVLFEKWAPVATEILQKTKGSEEVTSAVAHFVESFVDTNPAK